MERVPANHKDEAALSIAMGILTNENRTGFLDKLAVDGKLLEAAAITQSFNDAGLLVFWLSLNYYFSHIQRLRSLQ